MRIVLSETLSYCVGVRNTLELTERLLTERPDRACFMLGEIVHNEQVIEALRAKGLRVVQTLDEVPSGGIVILQSHGSPLRRYRELEERGLEYVDATCPMVRIIHKKVREVEAEGRTPVVIGRVGHEEIQGIVGQVRRAIVVKGPEEVTPERFRGVRRAGVVVQSTFIEADARRVLDRIREIVPDVVFHDTICQPTKTRQREVEVHTRTADCVIVIGSRHSANTMHLCHIARVINPNTHLVDSPEAVEAIDVPDEATVFIASGASTPEELIYEVVRRLEARDAPPASQGPPEGARRARSRPGPSGAEET
jgi:4-hydroxy-3-methylbut-2-enyl diphosphate reductase